MRGIVNGVVQPGFDYRGAYWGPSTADRRTSTVSASPGRTTHIHVHDDAPRRARVRDQPADLPSTVSPQESADAVRRRARFAGSRRDERPTRIEPGDIEQGGGRIYGTERCEEDRARDYGTSMPFQGHRGGRSEAGGDQELDGGASITARSGSSNPATAAKAAQDMAARIKGYWDRQRVADEGRRLMRRISDATTDQERSEALANYYQWVRGHTDEVVSSEMLGRTDPRAIRAPGDNFVLPARQIPGLDREKMVGQTSGGASGNERMSGYGPTRDAHHNPLVAMQAANKRFWGNRRTF